MLVMPLFHVHGLLAGFLAPLMSGGSVIIPPRFSASDFWHNYTTYKANWYTAVPTIHQILLKSPMPSPKPNIRFIRSCSSPLSPSIFHQLEKAFDAPVLEAYAMTEAAHQMTSNPLPPARRQPGSVGIGQGVEVKILDQDGKEVAQGAEAEICIRGENVTKGYLNNPEANKSSFTKGGFFRTGDQGRQDKDGYVFITGRIKELINKGGEKISPIELDNVLAQHPAVSEAVSFAVPDEMYGQEVAVAVVLKNGEKLTADELRKWVAEKVAKFKVPKQVGLPAHPKQGKCSHFIGFLYRKNAKDSNWQDPAENGCRGYAEARKSKGETLRSTRSLETGWITASLLFNARSLAHCP
jgi:acyl-CoA synthetase (AMP-forming)/AMP-acid ligase II